mmetsp:Transcript_41199/g.124531  ORF Transcript_41199/g.124531 Transcript_41199/m.124531 type:complete len:240 (+) Transcript_41199:771-1490(+)
MRQCGGEAQAGPYFRREGDERVGVPAVELTIEDGLGVRQVITLEVVVQTRPRRSKVGNARRAADPGAAQHHHVPHALLLHEPPGHAPQAGRRRRVRPAVFVVVVLRGRFFRRGAPSRTLPALEFGALESPVDLSSPVVPLALVLVLQPRRRDPRGQFRHLAAAFRIVERAAVIAAGGSRPDVSTAAAVAVAVVALVPRRRPAADIPGLRRCTFVSASAVAGGGAGRGPRRRRRHGPPAR